MSQNRKSQLGHSNDDIIPIEGDGIDLSALSHSGFFDCGVNEAKKRASTKAKIPQGKTWSGITLETIALDYASHLPQRVKVFKGVSGEDIEAAFSADDIYDIHFVRRMKTVRVRSVLGQEYEISRDSAVRAAPIFETAKPDGRQDKGAASFARVANVVAANPMPKMLVTCKSYAGSCPATSVEENETIAVLSVTFYKGYKYLHVYSFTKRCEKRLPLICNGEFSTHPARIHVPLPELIEQVRGLEGSRVVFFPESNESDALPQWFFKETFSVTDISTATVLVGTPYTGDENRNRLVEFSSRLNVEVVLLPMNQGALRGAATNFEQEYDKRKTHYFAVESDDSQRSETAAELLGPGGDDSDVVCRLQAHCDILEETICRLKDLVIELSTRVKNTSKPRLRVGNNTDCSQLQNWTQEEVLEFLNTTGLSQYRHYFASEMIDGMILSELDEEMCRNDLGMNSQNDWLKLKAAIHQRMSR